ncbi:MAG: chitobiase/beta-hexosaminidase C-terminal domain-containing protein, partial [Verrucomicrobiia bacterium]
MIAPNTFAHFLAGWLAFAAACAVQATAQSLYELGGSLADTCQLEKRGAKSAALLAAETDQSVPVVETIIPVPGRTLRELYSIEVQFNEPVIGVDAGDLLVNGAPATNMIQIAPSDFLFIFPQPGDGLVRIEWSANHGITDQAEPAHPFPGGLWTCTLDSTLPAPSLFISEFMADNKDTVHDEDGDSSDWIEIANSDSEPASLAGWYLTDNPANPTKWAFPEVDVPARGFILVFASGKNRADVAGKLHTNFKLASTGGYLALVDPRTNVVSEFAPAYPKQFTDVSYGRVPGEITTIGYFTKPTPGAQNASGGPGFAPAVEFSTPSCTFAAPFELELRTSLPNAVIRYTLDGNLPTNSSPVYAGPLLITNSVQVRARAYQEGLLPGPPASESYIILHTNVVGFSSDLPVIVLHTLGKGMPNATRMTFAHMSVFEPAGGKTSLTNRPTLTSRAGIQIRGSSTEGLAKSSYKLELWDEFNSDRKLGMLGMPPESDWVLYAPNNFEPVLIHNPFVHQLSRDMGCYSPRTRFVEVYLNKS